jgi:hypothetical protein
MPSSSFQYRPGYYIQESDLSGTKEITALYSPSGYGYEWRKECKTIAGAKRACTKHAKEMSQRKALEGFKPFEHGKWAAWESNGQLLLSDEDVKKLYYFKSADDAINWLFLNNEKPAARALNAHIKTK